MFLRMSRMLLLGLIAWALGLSSVVHAVTLRWANTGDAVTLDPYVFQETFTFGFTGNIYDGLVTRGKDLKILPALAVSWKNLDKTTWEFKLRKGVKFQEGQDFTSKDVVFSFKRTLSEGSQVASLIANVATMEAKGPYTVIVRTKVADPVLLGELSYWWIMSQEWCEKNNAVGVADLRKAATNFATLHANGTGAFQVVSREPDAKTVLKRNPNWWGWKSGYGNSNVDTVEFTPIKQDGTRVAALLSGTVDMLYEVPIQDLERIKAAGNTIYQVPETRTVLLGFDVFRNELIDSNIKGKNPFKDRRVRLALYKAVDEDLIVSRIMKGAAYSAQSMVTKEMAGYDPAFKRLGYNVDEAKKLLVEAGYPDGFEVGFDCPNDRYVNDAQICQAVAAMWAKIGVKAKLNAQTKSLHFGKLARYETSIFMLGWAPNTVDGQNALDNLLVTLDDKAGLGRFNYGRYSNPKVDALAAQSRQELNAAKRTKLLQQAFDIAHEDVATIPLHHQQVVWASSPKAQVAQRSDNIFVWAWTNVK